MRYAIARVNQDSKELAYRIYVTDALRIITENTAKYAGGSYLKARFFDQLKPVRRAKTDNRNGQEIADSIIGSLTKKGGGKA